jgi:hypothetical protein
MQIDLAVTKMYLLLQLAASLTIMALTTTSARRRIVRGKVHGDSNDEIFC